MNKKRILLVDDHESILKQLTLLLSRENGFEVVGITMDGQSAAALVSIHNPDILIIDPIMTKGIDMSNLKEIMQNNPSISIIALTTVVDKITEIELKKAGVNVILEKGISSNELVGQIRQV